jgi:hypothetical protein
VGLLPHSSRSKNKAWFEGKIMKSHIDLICYSIVFMNYWAGFNSFTNQEAIRCGASVLINVAMESHAGTSSAPRI